MSESFVLEYLFGEEVEKLTREERFIPGPVPASLLPDDVKTRGDDGELLECKLGDSR